MSKNSDKSTESFQNVITFPHTLKFNNYDNSIRDKTLKIKITVFKKVCSEALFDSKDNDMNTVFLSYTASVKYLQTNFAFKNNKVCLQYSDVNNIPT